MCKISICLFVFSAQTLESSTLLIPNNLPLERKLMRAVLKQHAGIFLLLLCMSLIFAGIGAAVIYFKAAEDGGLYIFGGLFLLAGISIFIFNLISNYSSVQYYYEKGLLKQYGREVNATITDKRVDDAIVKNIPNSSDADTTTERDCIIAYSYVFGGKKYDAESFLDSQALFDQLEIGQRIPILVLPQQPETTYPRIKKLKAMLKMNLQQAKKSVENGTENIQVSQGLMEEE